MASDMKVHLFNPGYEPSVALMNKNYTPPKQVQTFRQDLATLPLYFKHHDDMVLIPSLLPEHYMHRDLTTELHRDAELSPWGWAPELLGLFGEMYVPYSFDEMQSFTSRRLTLRLWQEIVCTAPDLFSSLIAPIEVDETIDLELLYGGEWVLKDEYSSSGRGVTFIHAFDSVDEQLIKRRKEGRKALFIEPFYDKIADRGYEFYRTAKGEVIYLGASYFYTSGGMYRGNFLSHRPHLEQMLDDVATVPSHNEYIDILQSALSRLDLGRYDGYLGVDTLVYLDDEGGKRLVPCLEINSRPTMGHLALSLGDRWLGDGLVGQFTIHHIPTDPLPHLLTDKPLYTFQDLPMKAGWFPLTPILNSSKFAALIEIREA